LLVRRVNGNFELHSKRIIFTKTIKKEGETRQNRKRR